ncbi:MAG: uncharacterized protein KVP18_004773 [Porospora cf. gigantea A]|uniref:uncharacterized protein n=1 Tax=Porospora cf. gigantea A TaxID=2853593 RepID=UPI00355A4F9E|nr:MAG: hypothetical protein KVP18_004773 [Porospora cf. gigantea A]
MFDWSTGRAANGATRERPDPEDQGAAEVEEISALNDYAASFLEAETDTKTLLSMLDDGPRPDFKASAVEDGLEAMACALTQLESSAYACEATDTRMAGLRDCKSRRKRLARLQRQWFLVTKENGCYIDERIRR